MRDGTFVSCDDMAAARKSSPDVRECRLTCSRIERSDLHDYITRNLIEELFNGYCGRTKSRTDRHTGGVQRGSVMGGVNADYSEGKYRPLRVKQSREGTADVPETDQSDSHSGMLPCFLRGMVSTFVASMRSARMTRGLVSCGSITSSIKPSSAAINGLAKRSRNSSIFWRRVDS